jgi:hypothetical protein
MPYLGLITFHNEWCGLQTYHTKLTSSREDCLREMWKVLWEDMFSIDERNDVAEVLHHLERIDQTDLFLHKILFVEDDEDDDEDKKCEYRDVGQIKEKLLSICNIEDVETVIKNFLHESEYKIQLLSL